MILAATYSICAVSAEYAGSRFQAGTAQMLAGLGLVLGAHGYA